MIRFLYNLLFPLGLLFFLPGYLVKMLRRGNYRVKFGQRIGLYDRQVRSRLASKRVTWIHAVSVGEVAIAMKLAKRLRELDTDFFCALTTTTTTGFAFARKNSPPWMEVMYNPIDFWPVVRRAFDVMRPRQLVLVEAEAWPNLTATACKRAIPIALVNARLSPRSERRFLRFKFFVAPIFRQLALVCVPEQGDVARWIRLGVREDRIAVTGSIKFDTDEQKQSAAVFSDYIAGLGLASGQPVLFGGSTHAGEEEILVDVFLDLRRKFPTLFLVLAPRHSERCRALQTQLQSRSLGVQLRSQPPQPGADCLLIDTTGELRDWYSIATIVFVGKSLTAHGGQNPVEPILAGKPVVFGPHMENFATLASELVRQSAAVQVANRNSLRNKFVRLLEDAEARRRLVVNANEVLASHRGATARTANRLMNLRTGS